MAIYRQIQTTFWQDSFVLSLTPEEKYFYIYLFTNSKTKQCGIYELPIKIAEVETGYNRETIVKLLQRFIEFGKIAYDWENNELAIKNWLKYNPTNNPKIKACVDKELAFVKNKSLIEFIKYCEIEPKYPMYRVSQKEKEEEKEEEKEIGGKPQFIKPNSKEVEDYAKSIDYGLDGQSFIDFYESKGWMIGKNKMKDWKAAVRTWKRNGNNNSKKSSLGDLTTYEEILKFTQNESAEFRKLIFDKYEAIGNGKFRLKH